MPKSRILAAIVATVAVVALAPGAGAQSAPSLSVTPDRPDPGDEVTILVSDCPTEPTVRYQIRDTVQLLTVMAADQSGRWRATLTADAIDGGVGGTCGDVTLDGVRIDVENPLLSPVPPGSFVPTPNPPAMIYGTDCPDGTTAEAIFTPDRFGPVDPRPPVLTVDIPIDEFGDWSTDVPSFAPGTTVTVSAACGDVTYRDLTYTVPDDSTTTSSTTTTTTTTTTTSTTTSTTTPPGEPPVADPADPAEPRPGTADFTG